MKHLNAIIIGASIVAVGVMITLNLPRYQYACSTIQRVDADGTITEDSESYIFDMVSARLHSRSQRIKTKDGEPYFHANAVGKPPTRSTLKAWKKQYEVFGDRLFKSSEWKYWKRANGWD